MKEGVFILMISLALASSCILTADQPIRLSPGPHLFIDDYLIAEQRNLERRVNQPNRLPKPVVTGPEDENFEPWITVLRDPETRMFRMWYNSPAGEHQSHLAYISSRDGIEWIRPHRVLDDPSHIQYGATVIDEGPEWPDSNSRYKFAWWSRGGFMIAVSPDGFVWKDIAPEPVITINHDVSSLCYDPIRKRYIALLQEKTELGGKLKERRRIPHSSVSTDLLNWKRPWPTVVPDERDEGITQYYGIGGVMARGDLLIGMLKVLRDDVVAEGAPEGAYGVGYTVLAWSRDGETWQWDRTPFMPRNPEIGAWDYAMTWVDSQVSVGDEVYLYYGGYKWGHKWNRTTERHVGLGRMQRDRYVSRDADSERGRLTTRLLTMDARAMTVNARVAGGMQVRILDAEGRPVQGFDWTDCAVITGDSLAHPVRWKRSLSELAGKTVRIEFALRDGALYGFDLE